MKKTAEERLGELCSLGAAMAKRFEQDTARKGLVRELERLDRVEKTEEAAEMRAECIQLRRENAELRRTDAAHHILKSAVSGLRDDVIDSGYAGCEDAELDDTTGSQVAFLMALAANIFATVNGQLIIDPNCYAAPEPHGPKTKGETK